MEILSIILLAIIIAVFALMLFYPQIEARRMKGKDVKEICQTCEDVLLPEGDGLIYFWSPVCGPCKAITPEAEKLSEQRGDMRLVNIAESADSARRLGVMVTPALVEIKNGRVSEIIFGARTRQRIISLQQ